MQREQAGGADTVDDFMVVAIHRYDHAELVALPGVARDAELVTKLLTDLDFVRSQAHLDSDSSADEIRRALDRWKDLRVRRAVIYWAGHAQLDDDELVLLLQASDRYTWTSYNAVEAKELARYISLAKAEEVLLILDTCYAGGAGPGLFARLWKALDEQRQQKRVWLLAAVSAADEVIEDDTGGGLVRALDQLVRTGAPSTAHAYWTQRDEFIRIDDLSRALEELYLDFSDGPTAGTHQLLGRNPLSLRFLRNLGHLPEAPEQTVAEAKQRRLSALDRPEAEAHFGPSSRSIEVGETGWYFTGRNRPLARIVKWLQSAEGRLMIVTGAPGAGKSALLGRLATLSDPSYRSMAEREGALSDAAPGTIPDAGTIGLSILLRGKTLDDCLRRVAGAHEIDIPAGSRPVVADLLADLQERGSGAEVVLLDALDEAAEPYRIADFIRQLSYCRRVLLGTRRNLGRSSGKDPGDLGPLLKTLRAAPEDVIWLDRDEEARSDIERYVRRRLADPSNDCAYQWDEAATEAAATAIAEHANGVFRLARDWCRLLCREPDALDPGSEAFSRLMRDGSDGVFARELARFEADANRAVELLTALAWSQGLGLPRQEIWPTVATAIAGLAGGSGHRYDQRDVIWALEEAGPLIIESGEHGRTVYRLYHEDFADYLREMLTRGTERQVQRAIADALADLGRADGWRDVDPYLVYHEAGHAAIGGVLDELLEDARFLAAADPGRLVRVIGAVTSERGRQRRRLYVQTLHRLRERSPSQRALALEITARQLDTEPLFSIDWSGGWHAGWAEWKRSGHSLMLMGHRGGVLSVAFGQVDERPVVATTSADATARLWDARSGEILLTLQGHAGPVWGVALATVDGRPLLATAGADSTVRLWDARTGEPLRTLMGHKDWVRSVAIGEIAGELIIATASADRSVRLWTAASGMQRLALTLPGVGFWAVTIDNVDGRPVVATTSADDVTRLWDARTGAPLRILEGNSGPLSGVAIGKIDGQTIVVTAGTDGTARMWDALSGRPVRTFEGHRGRINGVAIKKLGKQMVLATAGNDGTARLWDAGTGASIRVLNGHSSAVLGVAIGDVDGEPSVATAANDGTARLWDVDSRLVVGHAEGVAVWTSSVATGVVDGRYLLAAGSSDALIQLKDAATGSLIRELEGHGSGVMGVALGSVGDQPVVVTASQDRTARLWDARTGLTLRILQGHRAGVRGVALGEADEQVVVATASDDCTVRLWDPGSGEPLHTLEGHRRGVVAVAVAALDGRLVVASAGADGTARLWDARSGESVGTLTGHRGPVWSVAMGEVDQQLVVATAGSDRTVRLWDARDHVLLNVLEGHDRWVGSVVVTQVDGQPVVATGSPDGTVRLWDAVSGVQRMLFHVDAPVKALAVGGDRIVVACDRGILTVERHQSQIDPKT